MITFNNISSVLADDLKNTIKKNSRLSIAAACFSIYAYQELKKQLDSIKELRFIFTSPTFIKEKAPKEKREFYIPRLSRERSLHGSEFEVKLRNELTQKAIAKECADWIRKKAVFKSNTTDKDMYGFINVENGSDVFTYAPIKGFTTADIGSEPGDSLFTLINRAEAPMSRQYLQVFDSVWNNKQAMQDVTDIVIENISSAYRENSPDFIYFFTLYNIFSEFLEDISEDILPNEATGFKNSAVWHMLYDFQKDAVLAIISKLEEYNGCILADSVGLGKTFTALAVIKYYENRNRTVLVLCPKKLSQNWNTYKGNYSNNPLAADRLRYDVLYHTDLSKDGGISNGIDLDYLQWNNYDLVVIDESHNFRNGGKIYGDDQRENRYLKLLNKVISTGVHTKVLMLSATPVNNRFTDLRNQLALAYEGKPELLDKKLHTRKNIDDIFRSAQKAFNTWSKYPPQERTTEKLLKMLDFDFFKLLDSVTIARSRRHIEKYYNSAEVGRFPHRLKPLSYRPPLTDLSRAVNYKEIYDILHSLNLSVYTPSKYILPSKMGKYFDKEQQKTLNLTQSGREEGIRRLMSINLLKRLESSVHAFSLTLNRIYDSIQEKLKIIRQYQHNKNKVLVLCDVKQIDFDDDDINIDILSISRNLKIDLQDMDYKSWERELAADADNLAMLITMIDDITPQHDSKLQKLFELIAAKQKHPINPGNKKILIFTAFSDTADYLYEQVSSFAKQQFNLNTAEITGTIDGKSTIKHLKADLNTVLTYFSPISKGKALLKAANRIDADIDILIATDCISEGQNLQDCDYLINYDIHWNPVRIIQRFGRIDRIGSRNAAIQLVNFWPDISLDDYIKLKARVETRMKISVMTSTGDDDLINAEEKGDLAYRKEQLQRLQKEVVDIEDMSDGISIMDLGLNEFRLDLLEYIKHNPDVETAPRGMHAVVAAGHDNPAGVIYILKNIKNDININRQNHLHPFYMVYISEEGEIICSHLSPKNMLDRIRLLCKAKTEPDMQLCRRFNEETADGKDMAFYSELLSESIDSIIKAKDEDDIDSFLSGKQVSFAAGKINGLDDFELICFFAVKDREA